MRSASAGPIPGNEINSSCGALFRLISFGFVGSVFEETISGLGETLGETEETFAEAAAAVAGAE